ncbi:MAG: AAA family ATPase [Verrucomicrobiae bacterium]|nr:AAA family ATPase [Verrucomicrobiae bacterium]
MNPLPPENEIAQASASLKKLRDTLNTVLFGQDHLVSMVIIGLVSRGHILLEGLPGLGKTQLAKGLSRALELDFKRVQFTPDLLPGDITGNPILQELSPGQRQFVFQPGPLFANLVLADEINRASPKTQSALLEAMQEGNVTVMGEGHRLPQPFFVVATQNPIELEGTYPLPEAQLDRFLFKLSVHKNDARTLQQIISSREIGVDPVIDRVCSREALASFLALARRIFLPEVVAHYIARLVEASHPGLSKAATGVKFGASPRAALALAAAAKSRALFEGRSNASFEDVRAVALPVLEHRIILDYTARLDGRTTASMVSDLLEEIPAQSLSVPKTLQEAKLP